MYKSLRGRNAKKDTLATPSLFAADTQSQGLFAQVEVNTVADVKRYIGQAVAIQYGWTQSCGKIEYFKGKLMLGNLELTQEFLDEYDEVTIGPLPAGVTILPRPTDDGLRHSM
jgi:hypothetical protein